MGSLYAWEDGLDAHVDAPPRKRARLDPSAVDELLARPTARQRLLREGLLASVAPTVDVCSWTTRERCAARRPSDAAACPRVHFTAVVTPQTDASLGQCSFLNTCHRPDTCRYLHYVVEEPSRLAMIEGDRRAEARARPPQLNGLAATSRLGFAGMPPQWIDHDIRSFDVSVLPRFDAVILDPPWDIHQTLPYATLTDDEMIALPMAQLQDEGGLLFLWVTGRAMELGRVCLAEWGFERIDELVWLKTNQLGSLIRAGRTGHWLNHAKEHCLVAVKRSSTGARSTAPAKWARRGLDTDTIVAEVRETSRKPDELYELIERACPGGRKLEIFVSGTGPSELDAIPLTSRRYPDKVLQIVH